MKDDVSHRNLRHGLVLVALSAGVLAGCAGSQSKANGEENAADSKAADTAADDMPKGDKSSDKGSEKADKPSSKGKDDELNEAQREQMEIALRRGGDKASNCDRVVPGTKTGEGEVKVTFDGKKGRAVEVEVGAPWSGTPAESCIKRSFVGEIIVPFDGQLEVPYTVKIGPKAGADDKGDKGKPTKGTKKK